MIYEVRQHEGQWAIYNNGMKLFLTHSDPDDMFKIKVTTWDTKEAADRVCDLWNELTLK